MNSIHFTWVFFCFFCGPCQSVICSRVPSWNAMHDDIWELMITLEEDFGDKPAVTSKPDSDYIFCGPFSKLYSRASICWALSPFSSSVIWLLPWVCCVSLLCRAVPIVALGQTVPFPDKDVSSGASLYFSFFCNVSMKIWKWTAQIRFYGFLQ